ncbi:hypothetical protein GCM10012287_50450 [Streptomyces daqingensis]|uniref:SpdD protein n=1 Tax=Streptomyces daqingensis TaxID=1472640 RepID=A0ABQ2MRN6_9ACTN|nr:SpdD protein [Streptomyces daqingensis]GGO56566.1 hypothetical protein GCM10012287_50450 [Streptomyces daqingensis]
MLLKPQLPQNPTANVAGPVIHGHHPAAPAPVRRSLPSVSTGAAVATVLLGGVVLTALLTAVAVSAISVAIAAVVLRSLLNSQHHR